MFFIQELLNGTLEASGTLATSEDIQYLCTLLRGKAFSQLDALSIVVVSTTIAHLKTVIFWV